jgi:hypothetical protein
MGEGLEVFNESGQKIIDSQMRNVVLKQKIPLVFGQSGGYQDGQGEWLVILTIGSNSLVCIHSPYVPIAGMRSPSFAEGYGDTLIFANAYSQPQGAVLYVFEPAPVEDVASGLAVYDSSGQAIFNPDRRLMRIASVGQVPNSSAGGGPPPVYSLQGLDPTDGPYAACLTRVRTGFHAYQGTVAGDGAWVRDGVMTPLSNDRIEVHPAVRFYPTGAPQTVFSPSDPAGGKVLAVSVKDL